MAHYAYLDENNVVTEVIVGKNENEPPGDWENYYGALRTSYNTRGGVHYDATTGEPSVDQTKAFRKNFAGPGFTYDPSRDAFIPPQDFSSWMLDENTYLWAAPVPYPSDGLVYFWNEDSLSWQRPSTL